MERPKVGIGVFVIKDNKILMGKRKNTLGKGAWCLPGGHLEFFETFEECAKRESFEEAGIDITNIIFCTITNDMFKKEKKHYVTIFLKSTIQSGIPKTMEPDMLGSRHAKNVI